MLNIAIINLKVTLPIHQQEHHAFESSLAQFLDDHLMKQSVGVVMSPVL